MTFIEECGLMLEPQLGMKAKEVVEWTRYAERAGYGHVLRSDHLLPTTGERGIDSPECWVTLGMIAERTERIKFGPLVSPVGFRNPALLAQMACTLHSASNGRFVLSLGAGWYEDEYKAYGFPFPGFKTRVEQTEEALRIIRALTEGKNIEFNGRYFTASTECYPKPRGKVHLIVGGRNPSVVRLVKGFADEWNVLSPTLEVLVKLKSLLDSNIEISQMGSFFIADNSEELDARIKNYMKRFAVKDDLEAVRKRVQERGVPCGKVDDFVAQVIKRREAGIKKFYFQVLLTEDKEMVRLLTQTLKQEF